MTLAGESCLADLKTFVVMIFISASASWSGEAYGLGLVGFKHENNLVSDRKISQCHLEQLQLFSHGIASPLFC